MHKLVYFHRLLVVRGISSAFCIAAAHMEAISMVAGSGPAALESMLMPTVFFAARVNPEAARLPNVLSA